MEFYKLHGNGNDFLIVRWEEFSQRVPSAEAQANLVRAMCRQHYGAGADGLIATAPSHNADADFTMTLWNADGSRAEMSGNGVRCAAGYWYLTQIWNESLIRMATEAGIKNLEVKSRSETSLLFEVELGPPRLSPEQIPVLLNVPPPLVDLPVTINDIEIRATLTSMGNPHCSIFIEHLDPEQVLTLGPKLEHHPLFPARTNVEFVSIVNRDRLRVLFWERGVGPTHSSGTGSCAAAVAAMLHQAVNRSVTVESEDGQQLLVRWPEGGSVFLTGPTCLVYRGDWP